MISSQCLLTTYIPLGIPSWHHVTRVDMSHIQGATESCTELGAPFAPLEDGKCQELEEKQDDHNPYQKNLSCPRLPRGASGFWMFLAGNFFTKQLHVYSCIDHIDHDYIGSSTHGPHCTFKEAFLPNNHPTLY